MNDETTDRIRETLMNTNGSQALYESLAESVFPSDTGFDEDFVLALKEVYRRFFVQELKWIESIAESPIERIFCTGVLLIAKSRYFNLLRFTENSPSISEYQGFIRTVLKTVDLYDELLRERGLRWVELEQLFDEIIETATVTKDEVISVDELRSTHFLYRGAFRFDNAFHLTMQPELPTSVRVDDRPIRPDLYIWLPEDDSFKLIVECDGYRYHSDRASFTSDRKRDRVLKSLGYDVLRFSGLEIYKDPLAAAQELVDYLEQKRPVLPIVSPLHPSQRF